MSQEQFKVSGRPAASSVSLDPSLSVWSRVSLQLGWLILLFGICTAVLIAAIIYLTFNPIIQWDQWAVVSWLSHNEHISVRWLWAQHNEHRIPWGKLACYADLAFFGGRNISLLYEIYTIRALEVVVLIWIFCRFGNLEKPQLLTVAGFVVFCCFNPIQIENFDWGFQISFVLLPLAANLAIGAAILHADLISTRQPRPWCSWALFLSLISAFIAESSMASGIFVWPLLLLVAFVFKMPWRTKALIAAIGASAILAYFRNYERPLQHASPLESLRHPISVANYIGAYFGWSWDSTRPVATDPGVLTGAGVPSWIAIVYSLWPGLPQLCAILAIAVALIALLWLFRRGGEPGKLETFLLVNMVFCTITSLATALGRINFGLEQATSSRYQTMALEFWASFAGLMIIWRTGKASSVLRLVELQIVVMLLLLASVPRFGPSAALARTRREAMAQAYGEYLENPSDPGAIAGIQATVSPAADFPEAFNYLLAHHLGPDVNKIRPVPEVPLARRTWTPEDDNFLVSGWYPGERGFGAWSARSEAVLRYRPPAKSVNSVKLVLLAITGQHPIPFSVAYETGQIDGIIPATDQPGLQSFTVRLPIRSGRTVHTIRILTTELWSPADQGYNPDQRKRGIAIQALAADNCSPSSSIIFGSDPGCQN